MYTLRPRLLPLVLRGCCDQGQLYFVPPASTLLSQLRIDRLQRGCRLLGCSELLSVVVTRESTSLLLTAPPCLVAALLYNRRSLNFCHAYLALPGPPSSNFERERRFKSMSDPKYVFKFLFFDFHSRGIKKQIMSGFVIH